MLKLRINSWKRSLVVLTSCIAAAVLPGSRALAASGVWGPKSPMLTARYGVAVGEANGLLYAVGGGTATGSKLATLEAYDPTTNSWSIKAQMPTARELRGTNCAYANGLLYVIGGTGAGVCLATNEAYDPVANTWQTELSMPVASCHLSVVALNGKIYALGGTNTSGSIKYNLVQIYDPVANTWSFGPSMPTGKQDFAAGVVNGKLYAVGGWIASGDLAAVECFDPVLNTWSTKASMPTPRSGLAVTVVNGILYAIGGSNAGTYLSTVEAYDPASNTWSAMSSLPTARGYLGAAASNGISYAIGGAAIGGGVLATNEAFQHSAPAYGSGCSGSGGFTPTMTFSGCATPGSFVSLKIANGLGGSSALLFFGLNEGSAPIAGGCKLLVTPLLPISISLPLLGTGPGNGSVSVPTMLAPSLNIPMTFTMQAFVVDGGVAKGFANSNGVRVTIQ